MVSCIAARFTPYWYVMKILQKPSKKPFILGAAAVVILLAASLSYYAFAMNGSIFGWQFRPENTSSKDETNKVNMEPATENQKQAGQNTKLEAVKSTEKPETAQPSTLNVSFTSTTQSGDTLRVRAIIQQVVTGTCTLKLTKGSDTVTKTAPTYPNASATTCKGFDVPTSELSGGKWDITLSATAGKATGAATTSVNIEK